MRNFQELGRGDVSRDILCSRRFAGMYLVNFSNDNFSNGQFTQLGLTPPNIRRQTLPLLLLRLVACGLYLPSEASPFLRTDSSNGSLLESKPPIILLYQPPELAAPGQVPTRNTVTSDPLEQLDRMIFIPRLLKLPPSDNDVDDRGAVARFLARQVLTVTIMLVFEKKPQPSHFEFYWEIRQGGIPPRGGI